MADVDDGVETQGEFAALMESEGIVDLLMGDSAPGEEASAEEAPDDTGSAVERPRDPDTGRFVSQQETAEETTETAETPAPPDTVEVEEVEADDDGDIVLEIDEDLEAVLQRYDGDVGKALRSLSEKESMVGRQANEVGELRQQINQLQALVQQGFQQAQQAPQYYGPYMNDLEDNPKGLVYEALERGDAQTMQLAIRAWGEEEPFEASTFLFSLQQQAAAEQASVHQQPSPAYAAGPTLEDAMADVVSRHPDAEKYLPGLGETAQEFPTLRNSLDSGTPAQKAQAFEELLVITKARTAQSDTSSAVKRVILKTQEEVRKEKADAAVVSAQTRSAATPKSGLDQFYEAFDEAAERFSPADWITRSND